MARCFLSLAVFERPTVRNTPRRNVVFSSSRLLDWMAIPRDAQFQGYFPPTRYSSSSLGRMRRVTSLVPGAGVVELQPLKSPDVANGHERADCDGKGTSGGALSVDAVSTTTTMTTPSSGEYLKALSELFKLRLSSLVVATTSAGFLAAGGGGGPISWSALVCCTAGTALCSSSASALNQLFEMDRDGRMKRTRNRPLVQGVLLPSTAAVLGVASGLGGATVLGLGTDPTTTALGVGNIALYSGLYTYLKPRSELNTWVGAVVGAIPPVMGWTAAGGSLLDPEALLLGGTLYLWQFPHFFALAWMHSVDYGRGGFEMVPCNDGHEGDRTAVLIRDYAWYLSAVPFASTALGVTSAMFALEGIALNAYAIHVANRFYQRRSNGNARKVFLTSLWYLPCFMTLFILHSRAWEEEESDDVKAGGDLRMTLKDIIQAAKRRGREMCIHEMVISDLSLLSEEEGAVMERCPIVMGKESARKIATESVEDAAKAVGSAAGNVPASAIID